MYAGIHTCSKHSLNWTGMEWNGLHCNVWAGWNDYRLCKPFTFEHIKKTNTCHICWFQNLVCEQIATFQVAISLLSQWIVCTGWFNLLSSMTTLKSWKQNLPFILSFIPGFTQTSANIWNVVKPFLKSTHFIRLDFILHGHSTADDLRDLSAQEQEVVTFSPSPCQLADFFFLLNQCARAPRT